MTVGIVGYGAHLPRHRIKVEEIAKVWGADAPSYKKGLELREKSVPAPDQDIITLSVEAARNALARAAASTPATSAPSTSARESHPYAVKPSGTDRGRGHRRHARLPLRRLRVRLQGRLRGDVRGLRPGQGRAR